MEANERQRLQGVGSPKSSSHRSWLPHIGAERAQSKSGMKQRGLGLEQSIEEWLCVSVCTHAVQEDTQEKKNVSSKSTREKYASVTVMQMGFQVGK